MGEDVEVKKNAACSLFSERDPLPLERRFFGESKCLHLRAEAQRRQFSFPLVERNEHNKNTPINCNLTAKYTLLILTYILVIVNLFSAQLGQV